MSTNFVNQYQNLRTILCACPCCGELVRVSDLHLTPKGKARKTWLDDYDQELQRLADKEAEFAENFKEINSKAVERGRLQVVKRACACLDESLARFNYDPYDIKAIFHPANFVVFDGLNAGAELKEISFLAKAKKGDEVLRSLEEAIDEKRCDMKIARVSEDGRVKFES